ALPSTAKPRPPPAPAAPGSNVAATISRFRDSGHARCRRRLFVPITKFVDTSSHHAPFGDRSVVHPVALRKGGPRRRETVFAWRRRNRDGVAAPAALSLLPV